MSFKHSQYELCTICLDMIGRPAGFLGRPKECSNYDSTMDENPVFKQINDDPIIYKTTKWRKKA